jgi:Family of unknown function (DUF5706)
MSADKDRLQTAQWILERNLGWIAAAEVKVGVVVALDTAILGGLGAAFSASEAVTRTAWATVWTVLATFTLACGLFCAAMAVLPKVTGPAKSLVFFGRVGPCGDVEYADRLRGATDAELLADWSAQIHRNAQIACDKFGWVRKAMYWSFLSVAPWFGAILLLLKK